MLIKFKITIFIILAFCFLPARMTEVIQSGGLLVSFAYADVNQDKIEQLRKEIEELEKRDAQLQKEAEQYRGNIAETQAQANTLKNQIQNLKNQIGVLETNIKLTGKKI